MKLYCKGCHKKIEITDYKCPFCGNVNLSTDEEVRAEYNAHIPKGIIKAPVRAFIAVKTTVVTSIVIFSIIALTVGVVILKICFDIKADNDWAFEHVAKLTEFDKANSSFDERFEFTQVYSESAYPYFVMYITYNGEPENFIRESVSLCDMLYRHACEEHTSYQDELAYKLTCGNMIFNCERSRYIETNVLFDYSELELFGLKSLTVHTDEMSDEDIYKINSGGYSFEVYLK